MKHDDIALIRQAAAHFPTIERVVLFGSRAKGGYRQGSDVDLMIQGHAVTDDTVTQLADQLNEVLPLPYFFDVLNENTLSNDALRQNIKRVGIILFDTSHRAPTSYQ
ncbi:nucleotidyltransferase domain-containing protein [Halomonas sp. CH40]